MVDRRAILVAAASHDPPLAKLDVSGLVAVTRRSPTSIQRALAGDAPHILEEIRRALGLASEHPVSAR